jgi:hypothetical protein
MLFFQFDFYHLIQIYSLRKFIFALNPIFKNIFSNIKLIQLTILRNLINNLLNLIQLSFLLFNSYKLLFKNNLNSNKLQG